MRKAQRFTLALLFFASVSFGSSSKPTFESIFGEYAKAYYEFRYIEHTRKAVEKMESAVKATGKLKREERARVITLLMIKFEPDGEAVHIFREVIRENGDVDYLLHHTKALIGNTKAFKSRSEEQNLEIVISFLNSMKKTE